MTINLNPSNMKSAIFSRALLIITALLLSNVTCFGQDDPSKLLMGKWTKSMNDVSASFIISSDQKWEVEFTGDDELDVWGSYAISGNHITFTDEGGEFSSDASGEYEFKVEDNSLKFTMVDDPVYGRSTLVEGTWSRASDEE